MYQQLEMTGVQLCMATRGAFTFNWELTNSPAKAVTVLAETPYDIKFNYDYDEFCCLNSSNCSCNQ